MVTLDVAAMILPVRVHMSDQTLQPVGDRSVSDIVWSVVLPATCVLSDLAMSSVIINNNMHKKLFSLPAVGVSFDPPNTVYQDWHPMFDLHEILDKQRIQRGHIRSTCAYLKLGSDCELFCIRWYCRLLAPLLQEPMILIDNDLTWTLLTYLLHLTYCCFGLLTTTTKPPTTLVDRASFQRVKLRLFSFHICSGFSQKQFVILVFKS